MIFKTHTLFQIICLLQYQVYTLESIWQYRVISLFMKWKMKKIICTKLFYLKKKYITTLQKKIAAFRNKYPKTWKYNNAYKKFTKISMMIMQMFWTDLCFNRYTTQNTWICVESIYTKVAFRNTPLGHFA